MVRLNTVAENEERLLNFKETVLFILLCQIMHEKCIK